MVDHYQAKKEYEWVVVLAGVMLMALLAKETAFLWLLFVIGYARLKRPDITHLVALGAGFNGFIYMTMRLEWAKVGFGVRNRAIG